MKSEPLSYYSHTAAVLIAATLCPR